MKFKAKIRKTRITKRSDIIDKLYLVSVYKFSVWIIMFEIEALAVLKIKEFTIVNDCFQNENNENIGHYGQTLTNLTIAYYN